MQILKSSCRPTDAQQKIKSPRILLQLAKKEKTSDKKKQCYLEQIKELVLLEEEILKYAGSLLPGSPASHKRIGRQ